MWLGPSPGRPPAHPALAIVLLPLLVAWTLPQTLAGLALALLRKAQGHPWWLYRFGPFVYLVVPAPSIASAGISLGVIVLADRSSILTHEFCHLYTGLWLGWLSLPVYGLEYLILGHDGSLHERATCGFAERNERSWVRVG
jgi:hypothetical protein